MLLPYLGVLFALVAVLALVALAGRGFRRIGIGALGARREAPVDVLHRAAVGPRQGVALVRVGSRVVLLSMGDGGVHPLLTLADDEAARLIAASEPGAARTARASVDGTVVPEGAAASAAAPMGGAEIFSRALARAVGLQRALLVTALALGSASAAMAQAAPPPRPATTQAAPAPQAAAPARSGNPTATAAQVVERLAPQMDLRVGGGGNGGDGLRLNGTVGVVVMLGLMSLLPTLVLMTTGFTRILIVLYFLRQALGTQTSPPGPVIAGLALILTGFVMAPTMTEVNRTALTPWLDGEIQQVEMLDRAAGPIRTFMLKQTRPADVRRMLRLSRQPVASGAPVPFITLMAAFTVSELRTAFAIGFALFLPFIVIDVVVASVLMSLGMFMLPPTMIALPFKLLLFVLVDGWALITQSLVAGFR